MDLYPVTKFNEIKLPDKFSDFSIKNYIQMKDDSNFQDSRTMKDANFDLFATIKTQNQIPCCCGTYYFEIRLLTENISGFIGLGIANPTTDENHQLGKTSGTAGLYLFNRNHVSLWIQEKEYSITINEKMRVQHLGFGINFMESYVFCTVNGVLLLHMKELPPRDKFSIEHLYPAISSQSPQCSFSVNLGLDSTKPFSFNFQYYKRNQLRKKRNQCLSQEYSPKLAFVTVCNLVSDYLLHHGYAEAWEALNKYEDSQSKGQSLETIKNRRLIQKCILDQDYLGAIANINQHFPDFFQQYPIYRFILKCRHFINLIVLQPIINGSIDQDQDEFSTYPKSARLDPVLMKQKSHSRLSSSKLQAVIGVDLSSAIQDVSEQMDDEDDVNSNSNFNELCQLEEMETENENDSEIRNSLLKHNSSNLVAGKRVMYIIQYGKTLKEEGQLFQYGSENNSEHKQGLELLTTAFSLIAYRDPYNSPFQDILGPKHREDLAYKINGAINGMLGRTTMARLDSLLDSCLKETMPSNKNSSILAAIHPKLLVSELFIENK